MNEISSSKYPAFSYLFEICTHHQNQYLAALRDGLRIGDIDLRGDHGLEGLHSVSAQGYIS